MTPQANHLLRAFSELSAQGQLEVLAYVLDIKDKEEHERPTARSGIMTLVPSRSEKEPKNK